MKHQKLFKDENVPSLHSSVTIVRDYIQRFYLFLKAIVELQETPRQHSRCNEDLLNHVAHRENKQEMIIPFSSAQRK